MIFFENIFYEYIFTYCTYLYWSGMIGIYVFKIKKLVKYLIYFKQFYEIVIGVSLIILFNPFNKPKLTNYMQHIICYTGIYLLISTLFIKKIINHMKTDILNDVQQDDKF